MSLPSEEQLKTVLHRASLGRRDKLLLLLASSDQPQKVERVRKTAVDKFGLREAKKWNISDLLASGEEVYAIRTDRGWELNHSGKIRAESLIGSVDHGRSVKNAHELRELLKKVREPTVRKFLEEALSCLENNNLRAAVVLSWVGAVSVLQHHVVTTQLDDFNLEAKRRDSKWKDAKTVDDLSLMHDDLFLDVLQNISVLGKDVKQELKNSCLKLRNSCGHPNSLVVGPKRVEAHLEILILNIFSKFSH